MWLKWAAWIGSSLEPFLLWQWGFCCPWEAGKSLVSEMPINVIKWFTILHFVNLIFYRSYFPVWDRSDSFEVQGVCEVSWRKRANVAVNSMVQSPSWEASWFAASQEIPCISRNPKVHYRTHKLPPPIFILGPPNPVHIPTSHLLEIHSNIMHPSTPRSPQWSLSLRFPHQECEIFYGQ